MATIALGAQNFERTVSRPATTEAEPLEEVVAAVRAVDVDTLRAEAARQEKVGR